MRKLSETFSRRLQRRLLDHGAALALLKEQYGIGEAIADRYRLGLSEPSPKSCDNDREFQHSNCLVAPLLGSDGIFYSRNFYHILPGISQDRRFDGPGSWCPGSPEAYYSRKVKPEDSLFICESPLEVLALAGVIAGKHMERSLVLAAPTQLNAWPSSWERADFWTGFKSVFIALSNPHGQKSPQSSEPDARARELARLTGRSTRRVCPTGSSWIKVSAEGLEAQTFLALLKAAPELSQAELARPDTQKFSSAQTQDFSSCYFCGFLYEAIRVVEDVPIGSATTKKFSVVVVKSDRSIQTIEEMPAAPRAPAASKVLRLAPDGHLLERRPSPSAFGSWRWESIRKYIEGNVAPPLAELLAELESHLRSSVWLPDETDYTTLACAAAATYCQQIFDSVPLFLVNGRRGTGKTELALAMTQVCANSPGPIGVVSAATLERLVDSSRGFVAIDDLEQVRASAKGDPQFSQLAQTLKLSYKKSSAQKLWTDVNQNMQVKRLVFFGIKLINNTAGVDDILGSRMITIRTRDMPSDVRLPRDRRLSLEQAAALRDSLHTWAFCHVQQVAAAYASLFPTPTNREDEISAPLRVIAHLSGNAHIVTAIERKVADAPASQEHDAISLLEEAALTIVKKCIAENAVVRVSLTVLELKMRLQLLADEGFGKRSKVDISDIESPEWIGRQFQQSLAPLNAKPLRFQMFERGMRAWPLDSSFVDKAIAAAGVARDGLAVESNPRAFCRTCNVCDYRGLCPMQARKQQRDRPRPAAEAQKAAASAATETAGFDLH